MTSSSPILDVPVDRPVAPQNVAMLATLNTVLAPLNADYIVAGATARDIVLWNLFGVKEERATHDVDVAVCSLSWDHYGAAIAALLASGCFTQGRSQHTLLFQTPELERAVPLDIIPFGEIEDPEGNIRWPPDGKFVMGVQGFEEAIQHALRVRIAQDMVVLVTSPAALVTLKVIAWSERGARKNTDAPDILHIAKSFDTVLGDEIWNDEAMVIMAEYEFDHSLTAARLLGKQAYAIANDETRATLAALLGEDAAFEQFVIAAARTSGREMGIDSFEANKRLLEALRQGLLGG